ncbi:MULTISPECIES: D-glycero-beta-D-manno-heptose 1,7-bisphosphate 7-phosphatase [Providencia]|uniref:D-glycero-beta-D-manno-heptose 1,7-bisphosphate 7-phosphatase n=1 Tax=Providencia TaxID=586 RepID=UPI00197F976A|nr:MULTISPECIES: D-glycero-beta-D-manno-heptose 1,7-bisphosphate 7-phosphatase [Providencia]HEC8329416.1 D-glycero-beta-D-manno-heptose 1,7-bisphosphate 7-phosphatase [Providencia rettgeri]MBN4864272.1 D-glycero-beta-D-manno-heptose 1,7-bisphosphate 7-phosphatase [Providencia stuartii]MBN4874281.1 D-glycero-beta-D-manno-heptose 1,7-bisphosphate 7-phosphatase [Providencia stuartii]MBN4878972.1 D-glycero-beta-D-manno-heptose 1,7-bisphosphate 7-phosphatase [Providencia stuartii]MBN4882795.1 D-gly
MSNGIPAVFLDRDGTINIDHGYVHKIDDFEFIEGAIEAMLELKKMGYALVVVTNQSGIGRGIYTEDQFMQLTEWMDWSLADRGVDLDGIYFCPHHAESDVEEYQQDCNCRKPKPGMLLDAQSFLNIDMAASIMVGDKLADILAGKAANVGATVLVKSGEPVTEEAMNSADFVINSIADLPATLKRIKK